MERPEIWIITGAALLVILILFIYFFLNESRKKRQFNKIKWDEDQNNPLDVRLEIRVTEYQILIGEKIEIRLTDEAETFTIKLRPEMRGKTVRMRNALKLGAAHLFLKVIVVSDNNDTNPNGNKNDINNQELEVLIKRLRSMVLGNEKLVERLIDAEKSRNPEKNRFFWVREAVERWERDNR